MSGGYLSGGYLSGGICPRISLSDMSGEDTPRQLPHLPHPKLTTGCK